MEPLELADIQGNILRGYGFVEAVYLLLEVRDADAGRHFLGDLVERLQSAVDWVRPGPPTATNVAMTYPGLHALGVPKGILQVLPAAFREPIRERAPRLLDDTGPSAPANWDDGLGTDRGHVLVIINGRKGCGSEFAAETAAVLAMAQRHGLALVHRQDAKALEHRREHFGWADGFSQPAVEGTSKPTDRPRDGDGTPGKGGSWRDLKAGEFLHGYPDEDGQTTAGPAAGLLRNATFMVYRKLYQDIVAFREQLRIDAMAYGRAQPDDPPLDGDQLYELMAAKIVGRWRDGEPIVLSPRRRDEESRHLGDNAERDPSNDFRYRPGDERGFLCPVGAHIRRTNPRDALGWDGEMSRRHRIIRRGMPYGPFLRHVEGQADDGQDRGLIFVCFNASLERQFELVQRQWCNDGNAFGLGNEKDYLLGDTGIHPPGEAAVVPLPSADGRLSTGRVTIQGAPPHFVDARPPVVRTKGCDYLVMPGIRFVRDLASGR